MQVITPFIVNDANLLATNIPENDFAPYDQTATYSIGQKVMFIDINKHWVIRSLVNDNTGNIPTGLNTDTNWVKVSETNRWKMFDLKSTSQTVSTVPLSNDSAEAMFDDNYFDEPYFDTEAESEQNGIQVTLGVTSLSNALYVGNVQGSTLTVTGQDQNGAQIYSNNISLISTAGIIDAFTYFFSPIVRKKEIVLTLPPYSLTTYEVTIAGQGEVKCGTLLIGFSQRLGETRYGMSMEIQDYSIKQANEFGDFVITERAFSKRVNLSAYVLKAQTDYFIDFLNTYRATPLVWVGSGQYEGSIAYGFYKDYAAIVNYPTHTVFDLKIESLT